MGAAKKLEQSLVETKKPMGLAKKLALIAMALGLAFILFTITTVAIRWYGSSTRAELIQKMESGKVDKPLLYFLL